MSAVSTALKVVGLACLGFATTPCLAGSFLEMPDTTEVPDLEEQSLRLDLDVPPCATAAPTPRQAPG